MKTVHTFSVVFWLKKRSTRKDGTIPIYARITVDGIRADVSTKHAVLRTHWCSDTGRVRTKVSGARSMNDDLAKVYQDITQSKKELLEEGMLLTAQSIKLSLLEHLRTCFNIIRITKWRSWSRVRPRTMVLPKSTCYHLSKRSIGHPMCNSPTLIIPSFSVLRTFFGTVNH